MSFLKLKRICILTAVVAATLLAMTAIADVPSQISYQGRLTESDGTPVPDGDYNITFQIHEHDPVPMGEPTLWSSGMQAVSVTDGLFVYYLGSNVPLPASVFTDDGLESHYLRFLLEGAALASRGVQMVTVPFAFKATSSDTAAYALSGPGSGATGWVDDGSVVRLQSGGDRVGIGESSPTDKLVVGKNLGFSIDDNYIVCGNGYTQGYSGYRLGFNSDNFAEIKWYGLGDELVFLTRSSGINYLNTMVLKEGKVGINNFSPSEPLSIGVDLGSSYGDLITVGRTGVNRYSGVMFGEDQNNKANIIWYNNTNELRLQTESGDTAYANTIVLKDGNVGVGTNTMAARLNIASVYNIDLPETRYGVSNQVVCGGTGDAIGLYSHVHREQVIPFDTLGLTCAVDGIITNIPQGSWTGIGVRGTSWSAHRNYGVQALTFAGDQGIGIYAHADNIHEAWSAVLDGPVDMPAPDTKSASFTRIDHPLDPENMYLQHATVESSEMLNVYSGNTVLDAYGETTVKLPEWFDAMNTDFRYQLTCVGGYAPVYISETVTDNRFHIAGGTPGLEVSWQVTGVRNDPFAEANRLEVELDKSYEDQGLYRHPSAYEKSEAESIYKKHRTTRAEMESFQR